MVEDRVMQVERLKFFANAMLIKSLCSARAFERMLEIRDYVLLDTGVRTDHLALGYKLVVQFGLWGLLDHLIRFPELLELRGEPHLLRWWRIIQGEDGKTLKAAICDPETDLARVASGTDDLVTAVLRAGVTWDRIAGVNERLELLADELFEIGRGCTISSFTDSQPPEGLEGILRKSTVKLLHDSWVEGVDAAAFRYCLRKPTEWKHMELPGQSMFDIQTHRDQMSTLPEYNSDQFVSGWLVGKLAAVTVALRETDQWGKSLGDPHSLLRKNSDPDRAWEAGGRIFRDIPGNALSGFEFGLKRPSRLPGKILPSLSARVSLANPVDRLAALLGRGPILIGSRDARSALHVETIVSGLASTLPDDQPIDILRIVHGSESNDVNTVSLAVLMPLASTLGDSSEWWVFDRVHRAKGLDPNDCQWVSRFNGIAERVGKHINWIDLSDISVECLLSLCDYRSFQRLRSQFEELEGIAGEIRGAVPELLSAQLLSQAGYHHVRSSLNVTFSNGKEREIDAVGVRLTADGGDCKIIEIKKRSATQHDLKSYIHRFYETLRLADADRSTMAEMVGCSASIWSVSGLFISMAKDVDMSDLAEQCGIEFWNFDRFVDELRRAAFSERHIKLLQESLLVWENDFRDI